MIARHHEELEAWQLCDAIRQRLGPIVARRDWRADVDLRSQVRRAARSACSNVAEGFWRYKHPEFAHFVKIARASLAELLSHFTEAARDGLLSPEEHQSLVNDTDVALKVTGGLMYYLLTTPTPGLPGSGE